MPVMPCCIHLPKLHCDDDKVGMPIDITQQGANASLCSTGSMHDQLLVRICQLTICLCIGMHLVVRVAGQLTYACNQVYEGYMGFANTLLFLMVCKNQTNSHSLPCRNCVSVLEKTYHLRHIRVCKTPDSRTLQALVPAMCCTPARPAMASCSTSSLMPICGTCPTYILNL